MLQTTRNAQKPLKLHLTSRHHFPLGRLPPSALWRLQITGTGVGAEYGAFSGMWELTNHSRLGFLRWKFNIITKKKDSVQI